MISWEYHTASEGANLADLGRQGWELVAVVPGDSHNRPMLLFKRPHHDFRERMTAEQKQRTYHRLSIVGRGSDEQ